MASTATFSRLVRRCTRYALGGLAAIAAPLARCEEERKEEPFSKILDDAAAGDAAPDASAAAPAAALAGEQSSTPGSDSRGGWLIVFCNTR